MWYYKEYYVGVIVNFNNSIFSIGLVVIVLALVIYRQLRPRMLSRNSLLIIPVVLLVVILNAWSTFHPTTAQIEDIAISALASTVFGLLACRQFKVYPSPKTGKAMVKGSWTYFLWWFAALVVKAGLTFLLHENSVASRSEVETLVPVFLLMATRNAYLYWRVSQLGLELHGRGNKPADAS
jgi:hypothetical protein